MMGKCKDSDGPARSILLGTAFIEAKEERFGGSEAIELSVLLWRATAAGGGLDERGVNVEVSRVGWAIVIPDGSMSCITLAVARSVEVAGLRRASMVVWAGWKLLSDGAFVGLSMT